MQGTTQMHRSSVLEGEYLGAAIPQHHRTVDATAVVLKIDRTAQIEEKVDPCTTSVDRWRSITTTTCILALRQKMTPIQRSPILMDSRPAL